MTEATSLPIAVTGTVVKGAGRGKTLGFPTANIKTNNKQLPVDGVYAAVVSAIDGDESIYYPAACSVGVAQTFANATWSLEVHILDFKGDMYGKEIQVCFFKHLRDMQAYASEEELKEAIAKDVAWVREYFEKDPEMLMRTQLVNQLDMPLGAKPRCCLAPNDIFRSAGLWIQSVDGTHLLAQRSENRAYGAGQWSTALTCMVAEGESYHDAIIRELEEELALTELGVIPVQKMLTEPPFQRFMYSYKTVVNPELKTIQPNPQEVAAIRWVDRDTLLQEVAEHPERFLSVFVDEIEEIDRLFMAPKPKKKKRGRPKKK